MTNLQRTTAQEHLDYWISIMRDADKVKASEGEYSDEYNRRMKMLRRQAESEIRRWSKEAHNEYKRATRS